VCKVGPSCCNQQKRSSSFNNEINCIMISWYFSAVTVSEKSIGPEIRLLHHNLEFCDLHIHLNGIRPHREKNTFSKTSTPFRTYCRNHRSFQFVGKVFLIIFLETEVNVPRYLLNCRYLEQDDQNDVSQQCSRFHRNA
jgi:hypothetical protein